MPPEDEWPSDVTLSRKHFPTFLPRPITDFVPEINEAGAQLLLVRLCPDFKMIKLGYPAWYLFLFFSSCVEFKPSQISKVGFLKNDLYL